MHWMSRLKRLEWMNVKVLDSWVARIDDFLAWEKVKFDLKIEILNVYIKIENFISLI